MKPTLTYNSGYAQRLPSGDIEIQQEYRPQIGIGKTPVLREASKLTIPKSDAELLAKFILEGE